MRSSPYCENQALIVFCRKLFGTRNDSVADMEEGQVKHVDQPFAPDGSDGVRIMFAVNYNLLGNTLDEDQSNAMSVLLPDT